MQGLKDLFASERGIFCIVLVLASAGLVIVGSLKVDDWITYSKWIMITLVASKTVTGVVETYKLPKVPVSLKDDKRNESGS